MRRASPPQLSHARAIVERILWVIIATMSGRPIVLLPHERAAWYFDPLRVALLDRGLRSLPDLNLPGLNFARKIVSRCGLQSNFRMGDSACLGLTGWAGTRAFFPQGYWHEQVLYGIDCWEPQWALWTSRLKRNRVRFAMFSSADSAEYLKGKVPGLLTHWIPEAIADTEVISAPLPLTERGIDLLEYGRVHASFHDQARMELDHLKRHHVFPGGKHSPSLDPQGLLAQRRNAKLVVVYPQCDTHPRRAGRVETVTLRYFEGMAAGALLIGRAPRELIDLFGYDPTVTVDVRKNVGHQVLDILSRIEGYQSLVERNLQRVREVGVWSVRADQMIDALRSAGY